MTVQIFPSIVWSVPVTSRKKHAQRKHMGKAPESQQELHVQCFILGSVLFNHPKKLCMRELSD